jgi:hypothetical protein
MTGKQLDERLVIVTSTRRGRPEYLRQLAISAQALGWVVETYDLEDVALRKLPSKPMVVFDKWIIEQAK